MIRRVLAAIGNAVLTALDPLWATHIHPDVPDVPETPAERARTVADTIARLRRALGKEDDR